MLSITRACERSGKRSGAGRKSDGAERSAEREVAERERSGERDYKNRLERGATFLPLTLRSHALPITDCFRGLFAHCFCLSFLKTKVLHVTVLSVFVQWAIDSLLCMAAAHSDCCFFAPCTNILTYLLTYRRHKLYQQPYHLSSTWAQPISNPTTFAR